MIKKTGLLYGIVFFSAVSAGVPPFDYGFLEKELERGAANHVEFKQVSDTPIVYRTWGVWNMKYPAMRVADVALDLYNYSAIFRHVYRCERILGPSIRVSPLGTWYVEGRAAVARVWSIGNIDTLAWTDSTRLRLIASQNENRYLEGRWSGNKSGWFNYRTYGMHCAAFIVAVGKDSCRVGIVAQGLVKQAMPQWLIRLAMKIILPHLLADLEKEVKRRAKLRLQKPMPWYDHWLNGVRRLFL
jgi:hypothetical protein